MISFNSEVTSDYEDAKRKEWLISNSIGGYASSTIIGCNTRGYHGLLVAALQPSIRRVLLLSKFEEKVVMNGREYSLSVNKYPGVIHPNGHLLLKEFFFGTFPIFTYQINESFIQKKIFMISGENTTIILYEIPISPIPLTLHVSPLVNCRGYHNRGFKESLSFSHAYSRNEMSVKEHKEGLTLYIKSDRADYSPVGVWYENFVYDLDAEMGLADREDHYNPGVFSADLMGGERVLFIASDKPIKALPSGLWSDKSSCAESEVKDELMHYLLNAASTFLVSKDESKTVIAGYHWFGEWGRDAFISLPGLALVTNRFNDAAEVLLHFSKYLKDGLLPESFREEDGEPDYSSADTSLWFFYSLYKYIKYTNDWTLVERLYPVLQQIVRNYVNGTKFHIGMDKDGLIECSDKNIPLTWMDAVIDGDAITLRSGKVVEVNALWYNALMIMTEFSKHLNLTQESEAFRIVAEQVKESFNSAFWNSNKNCLFDYVEKDLNNDAIRPNQILAIGLPYPVLSQAHWASTLKIIQDQILTPFGLRTLSPYDPKYLGKCEGDQHSRDRAYHQGAVWPWLLGFYITADIRVNRIGLEERQKAARLLEPFKKHIREAGLGSISEIFDGDPPHRPRGCISQAWSVAEIIRSAAEDLSLIRSVQPT